MDDGIIRGFDDRRKHPSCLKLVRSLLLQTTLCGDVSKNQDAARDTALFVPDRCGTVIDWPLVAALPNQHRVILQPDDDAFAQRSACGVFDRLTRALADDSKHRIERPSRRLRLRKAGQRFCHGIHVRDASLDVGGDDGVADAAQRDAQQLSSLVGVALRAAGRLPGPDDEQTRENVGQQAKDSSGVNEIEPASRFDEQVTSRRCSPGSPRRRPDGSHPARRPQRRRRKS